MANAFLTLLGDTKPITAEELLKALSQVPFLGHQYRWFITLVKDSTPDRGLDHLSGYTGVRKLTPARIARLKVMVSVLKALPGAQVDSLPERVSLGAP